MSRFFSEKYKSLTPYTPGEQPKEQVFIKLNTNESPFPPSPIAQRLARQAAGDLRLYSDPDLRDLRAVAAEKLGIDKDEIIFTNGSDEILNFAFMAFCDEKNPAVFPNITYGFYKVFAELNGIPYREIPLRDDFLVNVEDYLGIHQTIFLANPNAPTGIALPLSDIEKIVASNSDHVVVIDEAYVDFGGESALSLIHNYPNLLVTQTFSKSRSLAGGRLGFGVACKELIADLNAVRFSTNPYNVNRMTAAAGIGALTDEDYFRKNCEEIKKNRAMTADGLKKLGFTMTDSKTNFLFAKHPQLDGLKFYQILKERGILIRHFETPLLHDYNRITVGSREEMLLFLDETAKILQADFTK